MSFADNLRNDANLLLLEALEFSPDDEEYDIFIDAHDAVLDAADLLDEMNSDG